MKKKLLITGATGFLGFRLVDFLQEQYEIIGTGRNKEIGQLIQNKKIHFLSINLEHQEEVESGLKNLHVDCVIHLAAKSSLWGNYDDFHKANVIGTKNILNYVIKNKIKRFIYISTPSVYDLTKKSTNLNETDLLYTTHFPNNYVKTKIMAEQLVLSANVSNTIILRPRGIFGPGDTSILPRLIRSNQRFGIPFINSAQNLVDLTYVDNVCEAIRLSIEANTTASGNIYNVTNGNPIEFFRLLNWLEKYLEIKIKRRKIPLFVLKSAAYLLTNFSKKEPVLTSYSTDLITKSITFDIRKIKRELGYEPLINIENGLEKTIKYYTEEHDFTGAK